MVIEREELPFYIQDVIEIVRKKFAIIHTNIPEDKIVILETPRSGKQWCNSLKSFSEMYQIKLDFNKINEELFPYIFGGE